MKFFAYSLAVAAAAAVTIASPKAAYGELVFEDDLKQDVASAQSAPAASAPVAPAPAASAPVEQQVAPTPGERLSRAEMVRRHRLREELKNEDELTVALEKERLKKEVELGQRILGSGIDKDASSAAPLQEQRVGSAADVASTPVQAAPAPVVVQDVGSAAPLATSTAIADSDLNASEELSRVTITPRGGISSITNSMYDIEARYSVGLGVSVDVSDHVAFSGGYQFSRYAVGAGNTLYYPTTYNMNYLQQVQLNDNVIDLGVKAYFLGLRSKVRPFIGGGGAYRKGYVNFDDRTKSFIRQYNAYGAQDVEISGFAGYIETGLDFKITKSIALTAAFKFFNVFSSRQNNPLSPYAFVGQNGYGYTYGGLSPYYYGAMSPGTYGMYGYNSDSRGSVGDALSRDNFYQLTAGVSISF